MTAGILTRLRRAVSRGVAYPDATGWRATHRHRKGGLYRRMCDGILEADRSDVVIYDDADGTVWVRARAEFEDGRFTPL